MAAFIFISTILVIVGRATVPGHGLTWAGTYEAFAHIWVGFVFALCLWAPHPNNLYAQSALVVATLVEAIAFVKREKEPDE
jgi:hypothetical protein